MGPAFVDHRVRVRKNLVGRGKHLLDKFSSGTELAQFLETDRPARCAPPRMNTQLWSQTGSVAIAAPSVAGIAWSTRPYGSRGAPRH